MAGVRRLAKELQAINAPPPREYKVKPKEGADGSAKWEVTLNGPKGSPYEGGRFVLSVDIPKEYPFKAPEFTFVTKIYHPSVRLDTGAICGEVFTDWKPSIQIADVINDIFEMMRNHLEPEVAKQLEEDPAKFAATARDYTRKYAH